MTKFIFVVADLLCVRYARSLRLEGFPLFTEAFLKRRPKLLSLRLPCLSITWSSGSTILSLRVWTNYFLSRRGKSIVFQRCVCMLSSAGRSTAKLPGRIRILSLHNTITLSISSKSRTLRKQIILNVCLTAHGKGCTFRVHPGKESRARIVPDLAPKTGQTLIPTPRPDCNSLVGVLPPEPDYAYPNDSTHRPPSSSSHCKAASASWRPCRRRHPRRKRRSPDRANAHPRTAPARCVCRADSRSSGKRRTSRSVFGGGCVFSAFRLRRSTEHFRVSMVYSRPEPGLMEQVSGVGTGLCSRLIFCGLSSGTRIGKNDSDMCVPRWARRFLRDR